MAPFWQLKWEKSKSLSVICQRFTSSLVWIIGSQKIQSKLSITLYQIPCRNRQAPSELPLGNLFRIKLTYTLWDILPNFAAGHIWFDENVQSLAKSLFTQRVHIILKLSAHRKKNFPFEETLNMSRGSNLFSQILLYHTHIVICY